MCLNLTKLFLYFSITKRSWFHNRNRLFILFLWWENNSRPTAIVVLFHEKPGALCSPWCKRNLPSAIGALFEGIPLCAICQGWQKRTLWEFRLEDFLVNSCPDNRTDKTSNVCLWFLQQRNKSFFRSGLIKRRQLKLLVVIAEIK